MKNDPTYKRNVDPQSLRQRLIKNTGALFSGTTIASFLGVLSFIVCARALGLPDFGALMLVTAYGAMIMRLCSFQPWQAVIRFASQYQDEGRTSEMAATFRLGWYIDFGSAVLAGMLTYMLATLFAGWFNWSDRVLEYAQLFAIANAVSVTGASSAVLRFYDRFDLVAWHKVFASILRIVIFIAASMYYADLYGFVLAWMIAQILEHLFLIAMALRVQRMQGVGHWVGEHAGRVAEISTPAMWRFIGSTKLNSILRVARDLDVQLVGLLVNESAVAILQVARRLAAFLIRYVDAILGAFFADLTAMAAQNKWAELNRFTTSTAMQMFALVLVPAVGFVFLGEWFLQLAFGLEYLEAYWSSVVLLVGVSIWASAQVFGNSLLAMNVVGGVLMINAITTPIYLLLLWAWVPMAGQFGAAVALAGFYVGWGVVAYAYYRRTIAQKRLSL